MSTLVGSETAAEANHQCVRVYALNKADNTSRVALVAEPRFNELLTYVIDELLLQSHTRFPYF